jgi:hypothetical protein
MNPHVVYLTYKIVAGEGIEFDNPEPLEHETDSFLFRLEAGVLTATPKGHFSTKEDARAVVERYLQAWELHHALKNGRRNVTFKYENAKIIDRIPPDSGAHLLLAVTGEYALVGGDVAFKLIWNHYPDPPPRNFQTVPPDAETLWNRFEGYLEKREYLQGMAYFCVTVIEADASPPRPRGYSKKRKFAADKYRVELDVIGTLAELSSTRGNANTARKLPALPLTDAEKNWMEAAVKVIVRRVAELDSTSDPQSLPWIKMEHLPPLS